MGQLERRAEAADDGAAGAAGGGDIRGVQLVRHCKYAVGMQDFGAQGISNTLHIRVANTLWVFTTMGTKSGERMMLQLERSEAI